MRTPEWFPQGPSLWQRLEEETLPLVLYGMGNGADKILQICQERRLSVAGVFASDEFVRGHSFAGFPVETLAQMERRLGRFVVLLAFATQRPEVMAHIDAIAARHLLLVPALPVVGDGIYDRRWLEEHVSALEWLYRRLADAQSRLVFRSVLQFRWSGETAHLRACQSDPAEAFTQLLRPGRMERMADLGAYRGDTIAQLLQYTDGQADWVLAMEPDRRNFRKLQEYCRRAGLGNRARLVRAAAWDCRAVLPFSQQAGRQSALGQGEGKAAALPLDLVVHGQRVTYLKVDVEGAEKQALQGAAQTIARWRPSINLALYHRRDDLFALPQLLDTICPHYRFYLRHHPYYPDWDTNLYAVAYSR